MTQSYRALKRQPVAFLFIRKGNEHATFFVIRSEISMKGETKVSKKTKKELIKRISMTLISGILLVFVSGYSFGWFAINKNISLSDVDMRVKRGTISVDFEYFMYDMNSQMYVSADDLSSIEFNQYDLVFRSRNEYTPIVIRLAIRKGDLPARGTLVASIYRDTTKPATETVNHSTQISAFSSSVMRFTPFLGEAYYNANVATQFTNVHNPNFATVRTLVSDDDASGSQVFTAVDYNDSTVNNVRKKSVVSLEFPYAQEDFDGDTVYAYIYVTYDEGLDGGNYRGLMGIYLKTAGLTSINTDSVQFSNDFVSIGVTFSTEQGG